MQALTLLHLLAIRPPFLYCKLFCRQDGGIVTPPSLRPSTKNNTLLVERAKVWRGGGCRNAVVGVAASCSDSVRPLSCILARRACSVGFASCETWGKHYHASLRLRSFGSARPCADSVRPPSCILCTFMNALWALRPCKASGRSFYKASVPYPHCASSPPSTKNNTLLVERAKL